MRYEKQLIHFDSRSEGSLAMKLKPPHWRQSRQMEGTYLLLEISVPLCQTHPKSSLCLDFHFMNSDIPFSHLGHCERKCLLLKARFNSSSNLQLREALLHSLPAPQRQTPALRSHQAHFFSSSLFLLKCSLPADFCHLPAPDSSSSQLIFICCTALNKPQLIPPFHILMLSQNILWRWVGESVI